MILQTRQLGSRRPLLNDWSFEPPSDWGDGGEPLTLRALITRIVLLEVTAFRQRQRDRMTFRVMSATEIVEESKRGAVKPGNQSGLQEVNEGAAVAGALTAFEDGIYLVLIDGEEQRDLEREVYVTSKSVITFIRLVLLAGF